MSLCVGHLDLAMSILETLKGDVKSVLCICYAQA